MSTVELLSHPLDCVSSDRSRWTVPSGVTVTVHHSDGPRWIVVLDGRVYRAVVADVLVATTW
jgi:hypothetical protein